MFSLLLHRLALRWPQGPETHVKIEVPIFHKLTKILQKFSKIHANFPNFFQNIRTFLQKVFRFIIHLFQKFLDRGSLNNILIKSADRLFSCNWLDSISGLFLLTSKTVSHRRYFRHERSYQLKSTYQNIKSKCMLIMRRGVAQLRVFWSVQMNLLIRWDLGLILATFLADALARLLARSCMTYL